MFFRWGNGGPETVSDLPKVTQTKNNKGPEPRFFDPQASCLSIHPNFPICKMGMILIPSLSLEHVVRAAAHLFAYPELNLQAEGLPVPTAYILTMWLVTSALYLPVDRAASPPTQERGWRDIKRSHSYSHALQYPPPASHLPPVPTQSSPGHFYNMLKRSLL